MFPNSLSFRLIAKTIVWTLIALLISGPIFAALFRAQAERDFNKVLLLHSRNLISSIEVGSNDQVLETPKVEDPNFSAPRLGWYWAVFNSKNLNQPLVKSASIAGEPLSVRPASAQPFDKEYHRISLVNKPLLNEQTEEEIVQFESLVELENSSTIFHVVVAGPKAQLDKDVQKLVWYLVAFFILFGLGTSLTLYFAIKSGLRPLSDAIDELHDIRQGRSKILGGDYPVEIRPLVNEINALIDANGSIVERARTQVGNLAHALKTPLAVMLNEVQKPTKSTPSLMSEQAQLMKSQVQTYLDRARIAAQRNVISSRTPVGPVVEKLTRVMSKLSPDIKFKIKSISDETVFRGEEQDLEEVLGNLLENASRFANKHVRIAVSNLDEVKDARPSFTIEISDDGPGLTTEQQTAALKRGMRLDESKPGSGLGLSIVRDIAVEYGGSFDLGRSELGGLSATIILPRVAPRNTETKK